MTAKVVCIGIATLDAIVAVERLPGSDERVPGVDGRLSGGGVAATAAVALARLGVPVRFVGRVGDDEAGRWIRDGLAGDGVDVAGLRLAPERSPVSVVLIEQPSGLRSLAPFLGSGAPIEPSTADLEACAAADWVHLDDLGLAALPALLAAGIPTPICVDDGVGIREVPLERVALWAPTERVLRTRFPAPNLEGSLEAALGAGPRVVAVTQGERGSLAAVADPTGRITIHRAPSFEVAATSTLGAGDVFHGALLAALVEGRELPDALRFANAAAALSTRGLDGRSTIPHRPELDAWLASDPPTRPREAQHAHA
jgi:sugar/nucleoside kinase (ribokinase family)